MVKEHPFLVGGEWRSSKEKVDVINPCNQQAIAKVSFASKKDVSDAIARAVKGFGTTKELSSHERSQCLQKVVDGLKARKDAFIRTICLEAGKPWKDAAIEYERAINTFTIATEEAKRIGGEVIPVDIILATKTKKAFTQRFPVGIIAGITPFNFPLNLVAHKIAPAMASGNAIIIKPASSAPLSALLLAELVLASGYPKEAFSVIPCSRENAETLITDERIKLLSFTGSSLVGWKLKEKAGRKKVVLELGGNAAVVVHEDADLELAAQRCTMGGFSYAGQSCISVQRIYVHKNVYASFTKKLIENVKRLKVGDPLDPATDVGPMVDEANAKRIEQWVNDAVKKSGKILCGGKRDGPFYAPTVLENVPKTCDISCNEAFGPIVLVEKYSDFKDAIARVNDSVFGLQVGVYVKDINKAFYAFKELDVGGVVINDVPTFRVDNMPYGGIKESGLGREGVRYAIEEMTEIKLMIVHLTEVV